jgi:hypothetical protein
MLDGGGKLGCQNEHAGRTLPASRGELGVHRSLVTLLLGTALLTTACSGGSSGTQIDGTGNPGSGDTSYHSPSKGTITLFGAVSGTVPCLAANAIWTSTLDRTSFDVGGSSEELGLVLALVVQVDGSPRTGTFSLGDSGVGGTATISNGASTWTTASTTGGSYTITVSTLDTPQPYIQQNDRMYDIHGTAHATIPAATVSEATGTIDLDMTF